MRTIQKSYWLRLLFLGLLLVFITGTSAEPRIEIQTRYYPVSGQDPASIYRSLQANGPTGSKGSYHAHTQWDIRWGYRWIEADDQCRLTRIDVSIDINFLLPQLQGIDTLPEPVRASWDRYYQALLRHEEHHKDYGIKAAHELEHRLLAVEPQSCFGLENRLKTLARGVIDKYDAMEQEYDRETDHGVKEGVVLEF